MRWTFPLPASLREHKTATIDEQLLNGAISGLGHRLALSSIIHSWAEVWFGKWVPVHGLD
jgi:hypothetical protein